MSGSTRASSPSSKTCAWRSTTRSSVLVWTRSPSTGVWSKPPAVVKPPGNHRLTGENKVPHVPPWSTPSGCPSAASWPTRTATTRSCWNPLEHLARFDHGLGFSLPEHITVHLDAGYDSHKTRERLAVLGCEGRISTKDAPLQADTRWVVERTNSWHNRGFRKPLMCTERRTRVIEAFSALANAIIILRRLIRQVWTTHRWDKRPERRPRPIRTISKTFACAGSLPHVEVSGWA